MLNPDWRPRPSPEQDRRLLPLEQPIVQLKNGTRSGGGPGPAVAVSPATS